MDFIEKYPHIVFPEPNSGCWLCVCSNNRFGYARILVGARKIGAHRVSYQMTNGVIPEGMEVDHLCSVTCCVNPDHLEAVTQEENKKRQARRIDQMKQHCCVHGHLRSAENTYTKRNGHRECRICRRHFRLKYAEKVRSAA